MVKIRLHISTDHVIINYFIKIQFVAFLHE